MSEERLIILKMLEEGKIGADEASKLLAAIKEDDKDSSIEIPSTPVDSSRPTTSYDSTEPIPNNKNAKQPKSGGSSINFDELGRSIGSISMDMAKKAGIFAKEMAPKLQSITETLVEKTVSVTDKISKSLATPPAPPRPASPEAERTPPTPRPHVPRTPAPRPMPSKVPVSKGRQKEKSCEIPVTGSSLSELYITSKNGFVYIKGYNGDKITAKLSYTSVSDNINLTQSGDRYYLDYDEAEFNNISIEAFVPEKLFNRIQISAINSKVSLDGIGSNEIVVDTEAAGIILKNIGSNYIRAVTDKGEVILENIASSSLEVITANAKIDANSLDVHKLKLETDNAPIVYKLFALKNYTDYNFRISTSNAGMKLNLPISEDIGYDIKAITSLNNVSAGITNLRYTENTSNYIKAKTSNFDMAHKKVIIDIDTSNAPITIN